jgi:hypothetical protein
VISWAGDFLGSTKPSSCGPGTNLDSLLDLIGLTFIHFPLFNDSVLEIVYTLDTLIEMWSMLLVLKEKGVTVSRKERECVHSTVDF